MMTDHCVKHGHYWDRLSIDCTKKHCEFGGERGACWTKTGQIKYGP